MRIQEIVARNRAEHATTLENLPVGESQANGSVERAIQAVQGQIRTFKDMVETHMKKKIGRRSDLFRWLVEWAVCTITRYRVTESGRSAFGNIKGREGKAKVARFGEKVMYFPFKNSGAHQG